MKPKHKDFRYFIRTLSIIIGLVLIWRGIWHAVDYLDIVLFNDNKLWTALGGIVLGVLMLYIPDRDLKEIEKL